MPESTRGRDVPVPAAAVETSGSVVVDMADILTHGQRLTRTGADTTTAFR
ncbi:hypothetical protein GCM10023350_17840 [Nocardioides endophyticus]|uniref:Uncharacterized protein n=1 Tax=Nocardioides endophyticus TaxID=1353775 RepID=A0ABP8YML7_9ACTN